MDVDVPTVTAWVRGQFPQLPHVAVGHSIGGQALLLGRGTEALQGFVTIASHAGVTRTIRQPGERLRVGMILRILGPVLSRALGYFPGRRLGVGEDIPAGAMLEWSRWSRMPGYFFDDPSMDAATRAAGVRGDALVVGFTDDRWATPGQIDALADQLVNATVERRTYDPAQLGVAAIGHMGFFRRGLRQSLWPQITDWLTLRVTAAP
jgi:predicted alpha/beta hydrolase